MKIREFEHVAAGPNVALLRVSGRPPRRAPTAAERPALLVELAGSVSRFPALPSPPDERGVVRAAFSVPASLVVPDARYSLQSPEGAVVPLPAPTRAATRPLGAAAPPTASREPGSDASPADDAGMAALRERLQALETENAELRARLEDVVSDAAAEREALQAELEGARVARKRAERELEDGRDAVRKMTFERDELGRQAEAFDQVAVKTRERAAEAEAAYENVKSTLEELEIWRGELERRLAATTTELGEARTRLQERGAELERLRAAVAAAEERAEAAERHATALGERVETAAAAVQTDSAAGSREELERLTEELAGLRAERTHGPAPAEGDDGDAAKRIQALEAEREELARQAAELTALLDSVEQFTDLARDLERARTQAEGQGAPPTAQAGAVPPAEAGIAGELPPADAQVEPDATVHLDLDPGGGSPAADADADREALLEQISRRAVAQAGETAARELAEAVSAAPPAAG